MRYFSVPFAYYVAVLFIPDESEQEIKHTSIQPTAVVVRIFRDSILYLHIGKGRLSVKSALIIV